MLNGLTIQQRLDCEKLLLPDIELNNFEAIVFQTCRAHSDNYHD